MANANNLGLTPEQLARLTVVDHPLVQHKQPPPLTSELNFNPRSP